MSAQEYRLLVKEWAKAQERIKKRLEEVEARIEEIEAEKSERYMDMIELTKKLDNAEKHLNLFLDLLEGKK